MPYLHSNLLDDPLAYERQESFAGGMNGYTRRTLLKPAESQHLENVVLRTNHLAESRKGADPLGAAYPDATGGNRIQSLRYYDKGDGATPTRQLLTFINGTLWKWDNISWASVALGGWSTTGTTRPEMVDALDKMYITDGVSEWLEWDGSAITQLGNTAGTAISDAPLGATIAVWHQGRMLAAGFNDEIDTVYASDLLTVANGNWDHIDNKTRVGHGESDGITALVPAWGDRVVAFKRDMIYVMDADPAQDAKDWIIEQVTISTGCVGKWAAVRYGSDVMFLARDGVRTIRRMGGDGTQVEVAPPLSQPIQNYIDRINWEYAHISTAVKCDEFVFFSVPLDDATTPDTVLTWNGRLGVWMGIWTGWTPQCWEKVRFDGVEELTFGDVDGYVPKWKNTADDELETTYEDRSNITAVDYATKIKTKAWQFNEPISIKDGEFVEVRFRDTKGEVTVKFHMDDEEEVVNSAILTQEEVTLPVVLPFILPSGRPKTMTRPMTTLSKFNELAVEVIKSDHRMVVKNITAAAFLNTVENESEI